jgi:hypothetical protein
MDVGYACRWEASTWLTMPEYLPVSEATSAESDEPAGTA